MRLVGLILMSVISLSLFQCAPKRIPGLEIDLADTPDHRAILKVLEDYRQAFEKKDVDGLLALAAPRFYEDSGTAKTDDDYDYAGLKEHFTKHFKLLKTVQLNIRLRKISVVKDRAQVDYRYITRYLMDLPAGEKWQVVDELNRMELVRINGAWKVLSGF